VNAVSIIPVGTVTFLFTDLEGSTRSWEHQGPAMSKALARHDAIVRTSCSGNNGYVFKTLGDAFCVAFGAAHDALAAAIDLQLGLLAEDWHAMGMATPLSLRLALHTGPVETREGDYFGPTLNRTSRLLATAHGGQSLLSEATAVMVREHLLGNMALKGLGEHRLKDLQRPESVYQLVCPPLPVDFPPLRSLEGRPHNLPLQLTLFVGREGALADAAMRLRDPGTRLLTLLGPGGTGKTRISLQLAAECLHDFADGAFFVALDPVRDPDQVAMAIASVLGIKEVGGSLVRGAVADFLASRNLLLVLDNFEQVVEAGPLVSELLRAAPGLKVVVTSRESLRITGEKVVPITPLELPSLERMPPLDQLVLFEAVRLFIDRAMAVKPDFTVTNENAPAVAEICHRLDGLPLAIELAASRVRLFEPETLLLRLDRGLGTMLTGGARDLSARQQTLRGAIAWSVQLLSVDERMLFIRLGVFLGGFTVEAAEAVGSDTADPGMVGDLDVLSGIESLADKSLVRRDGGTVMEPRFRMLETIRDHAWGMAREAGIEGALRDRHLEWITGVFTSTEESARRLDGTEILERLHAELGNLRQALAWASQVPVDGTRVTLGLKLCISCGTYWHLRHDPTEGVAVLDRLLALVDPLMPGGTATATTLDLIPSDILAYARVCVMRDRGWLVYKPAAWIRPLLDGAVTSFRNAGNRRGEGRALLQLATFLDFSNDDGPDNLRAALGALEAATEAGDALTIAQAQNRVGVTHQRAGRDDEAGEDFARALVLAQESGDRHAISFSRMLLGFLHFNRRQWDDADRYFTRNDNHADGGIYIAGSLYKRSDIAMHSGEFPLARAHLARLAEGLAHGYFPGVYSRMYQLGIGRLARLEGNLAIAKRSFESLVAGGHSWQAVVELALARLESGKNEVVSDLLREALTNDPHGKNWHTPLPSLIAAVAEQVVARDPARGILIGAMASRLGTHAWYLPPYAQDEARITAILDQARVTHGIPIPDVPADLTAADAIAQCLEALASMEGVE